jgi:hypothetical protein
MIGQAGPSFLKRQQTGTDKGSSHHACGEKHDCGCSRPMGGGSKFLGVDENHVS